MKLSLWDVLTRDVLWGTQLHVSNILRAVCHEIDVSFTMLTKRYRETVWNVKARVIHTRTMLNKPAMTPMVATNSSVGWKCLDCLNWRRLAVFKGPAEQCRKMLCFVHKCYLLLFNLIDHMTKRLRLQLHIHRWTLLKISTSSWNVIGECLLVFVLFLGNKQTLFRYNVWQWRAQVFLVILCSPAFKVTICRHLCSGTRGGYGWVIGLEVQSVAELSSCVYSKPDGKFCTRLKVLNWKKKWKKVNVLPSFNPKLWVKMSMMSRCVKFEESAKFSPK